MIFFLPHSRHFDKCLSEMFLEWSSTKHMNSVQFKRLNWIIVGFDQIKKKKKKDEQKKTQKNKQKKKKYIKKK